MGRRREDPIFNAAAAAADLVGLAAFLASQELH